MGELSLLAAARQDPGRDAWVAGAKVWTFGDLAVPVAAAAAALQEVAGEDRERPVGLVGTLEWQTLLWFFGAIETRIPVALAHPRLSALETERFFRDCGVSLVLREAPPTGGAADLGAWDGGESEESDESLDTILAIVQTSGSTAGPKAVALSRRAFLAAAAGSAANLGWRPDDRWLLSLPVAHIGGLSILTRCLLARRAVVVEPRLRFDPAEVAATIRSRRVTLLSLVPTTLARLLDLKDWRPPDFLRAVLVGGAAAPSDLLRRAADRGVPVLSTYGLTEACSQVATRRLGSQGGAAQGCGRPLPGLEVRIRHGRVELRGASLLSGYLTDGALQRRDPGAWLTTGDLGSLDAAGRLTIHGRADRVIISGGENVSPEEVERCLCSHAQITEACVFATDDPTWGQVVSAVVTARGPLDLPALTSFLELRLAPFKRPRLLAQVPELPRLPSGKVDLRAVVSAHAGELRAPGSR